MSVIYDSNWSNNTPAPKVEKKYKVDVTGPYGAHRELIMTGTSRRNIFKQLANMIEDGDAFTNPIVTELK